MPFRAACTYIAHIREFPLGGRGVLGNLAWFSQTVLNFEMLCCLLQYSGDSDDKLWLYEQNELPITGGKVTRCNQ